MLEFKKEQIVKLHDVDLSSAKRNDPLTKPNLVKFIESPANVEPQKETDGASSVSDQQPKITPKLHFCSKFIQKLTLIMQL